MNVAIVLPLLALAGTSSFSMNDEIYSWGLWAVQLYHGHPLDMTTGSPYPPLLSILLAYGFKLLGSTELQASAKISLIIFPFAILQLISYISAKNRYVVPFYLLLIVVGVFPGHYYIFYSKAYADPLMAAALLGSVAMYLCYQTDHKLESLSLSVICALVAMWAKQPGILRASISLPLSCSLAWVKQRAFKLADAGLVLLLFLSALMFALVTGYGFWINPSVVHASFADRNWWQQLDHASYHLLILHPSLLILFIFTIYLALTRPTIRWIYFLFVLPGLILWLLLGAYQLRLGVYLSTLCVLLIARTDYGFDQHPDLLRQLQTFSGKHLRKLAYVASAVFLVLTVGLSIKLIYFSPWPIYTLQGGRTTLNAMFGQDGAFIYQHLYDKQQTVWIAGPFAYGAFYKHAKIVHPDPKTAQQLTLAKLLAEIKTQLPDYLISSGKAPSLFPKLLDQLAAHCPSAFKPVAYSTSLYGFSVYQLQPKALKSSLHRTKKG